MIVFISGGAGSGKLRLAEARARATGKPFQVIATAGHSALGERFEVPLDSPVELAKAVAATPAGQTIIFHSLTQWTRQLLVSDSASDTPGGIEREGERQLKKVLEDARARRLHLIIVSSDLNEAPLAADPGAWRFVTFLQRLHRLLAHEADSVIEAVAGCAVEWKPSALDPHEPPGPWPFKR
ncbi:bifunctional adenosylcobinamide kinase/adenosylcobinamide-phosphate guanylyltransferase [Halomonas sp. HNIBRBA4712]|uniref:bifunctional adenosylcobinamide kinase/adenosylcobinamide-phosphate guanylyltransferase n=1 Tax=Halomonas sp. HNIBRBA4712 TaxID=3373087 RepID=UPI003747344F